MPTMSYAIFAAQRHGLVPVPNVLGQKAPQRWVAQLPSRRGPLGADHRGRK